MRINVLGETQVVSERGTLTLRDFGGVKTRQILEILALNRQQPVAKERLAELLWERQPPGDHIATLESYVSVLRSKIEPGVPRAQSVIVTGHGCYSLDRSRVSVDLDEFDELVHDSAVQAAPQARAALLAALELVRGPVLPHEPYAGWAASARGWYQAKVVEVNVSASELCLHLDDSDSAARLAETAARLDPLSESACQAAMRAYAAGGRKTTALRCYDAFRRMVREEMGVEPSDETRTLFEAVLSTDSGPAARDGSGDLAALVDAVVELYARAGRASALGRSGVSIHLPAARSAHGIDAESGPERLLSELLALARLSPPAWAVAG